MRKTSTAKRTLNPANERIKREYLAYLRHAEGFSEPSLDAAAAAIARFEAYTGYRDFKNFHIGQAKGFKAHLAERVDPRTKKPIAHATRYSLLMALKRFFKWLAGQQGYRSRVSYSDAEYFNMTEKEARVAKAERGRTVPTVEQIGHVLRLMPKTTVIERRNRALVAFTLLTGARDRAIASFKLKHVDVAEGLVRQDAREVKTKFSKTFTTWFFPVGDEVRQIVVDWIEELRAQNLWGPDDPLFPKTKLSLNADRHFEADGIAREHWSNASPIRKVFKDAFDAAGLPYANPHLFRSTLAQLGERMCHTPEKWKAWSQNLGHEREMTTFRSYGEVSPPRQGEIIRSLGAPRVKNDDILEQVQQLLDKRKAGVSV